MVSPSPALSFSGVFVPPPDRASCSFSVEYIHHSLYFTNTECLSLVCLLSPSPSGSPAAVMCSVGLDFPAQPPESQLWVVVDVFVRRVGFVETYMWLTVACLRPQLSFSASSLSALLPIILSSHVFVRLRKRPVVQRSNVFAVLGKGVSAHLFVAIL